MELVRKERDADEDRGNARPRQDQHGHTTDQEHGAENDPADADGVLDHARPQAAGGL
jgi:hypothetical protein